MGRCRRGRELGDDLASGVIGESLSDDKRARRSSTASWPTAASGSASTRGAGSDTKAKAGK